MSATRRRPTTAANRPGCRTRFRTSLETAAAIGFLRNYKLIEHFARAAGIDYHVLLQPEVVFEDDQRLRAADRAIKATTERLYALSGSS